MCAPGRGTFFVACITPCRIITLPPSACSGDWRSHHYRYGVRSADSSVSGKDRVRWTTSTVYYYSHKAAMGKRGTRHAMSASDRINCSSAACARWNSARWVMASTRLPHTTRAEDVGCTCGESPLFGTRADNHDARAAYTDTFQECMAGHGLRVLWQCQARPAARLVFLDGVADQRMALVMAHAFLTQALCFSLEGTTHVYVSHRTCRA